MSYLAIVLRAYEMLSCSWFYRFRLFMFLVLQIPAFHVPGFTDSGFSCSWFYRFRLFMFLVLQIPAFHVPVFQGGGMRGAATAKFNRNSPRRYKRRKAASRLDFLRLSVISFIYQTHVRPTHATGKRNSQ